jgi:hypothetical protein
MFFIQTLASKLQKGPVFPSKSILPPLTSWIRPTGANPRSPDIDFQTQISYNTTIQGRNICRILFIFSLLFLPSVREIAADQFLPTTTFHQINVCFSGSSTRGLI